MRTTGIICEYNPIHNGHVKQIEYARANGADVIVCIMSGNFTQRGEFAIADKYTRAKAAIAAGADVVFELPFPFSSMSAEFFARAGVYILAKLGVDTICFGHECDDVEILRSASEIITSDAFIEKLNQKNDKGNAKGFFDAFREVSGSKYTLGSNDILGAYYLAAIKKLSPSMNVLPLKRVGSAYNEDKLTSGILPSANAIRNVVSSNGLFECIPEGNVPNSALDILIDAQKNSLAPVFSSAISSDILTFFRLLNANDIKQRAISLCGGENVLDDGCGIVERLIFSAKEADSLDEMLNRAYNAKFTNSRMNRVLLFSLFGVSDAFKQNYPEYTTLLASNKTGRAFLSSIRKTAEIKIVTKPADAPRGSVQFKITSISDALYASAMPRKLHSSYFSYLSPYIEI